MRLKSALSGIVILMLSGCSWAGAQQPTAMVSATAAPRATTSSSAPAEPPASGGAELVIAERVAVTLPAPLDARLPGSLLGVVSEEHGERTRTWYAAVRVPEANFVEFFTLVAGMLRDQGYRIEQVPGSITATHFTAGPAPRSDVAKEDAATVDEPDSWVYLTTLDSQYPESLAEGQRYVSVTVVESTTSTATN